MDLRDGRDFEKALERVSALLESPPRAGTAADAELAELLSGIAEYGQELRPHETQSALSTISERAEDLVRHAERVRRALKRHQGGEGFGGLPFDGRGMGPSTGA